MTVVIVFYLPLSLAGLRRRARVVCVTVWHLASEPWISCLFLCNFREDEMTSTCRAWIYLHDTLVEKKNFDCAAVSGTSNCPQTVFVTTSSSILPQAGNAPTTPNTIGSPCLTAVHRHLVLYRMRSGHCAAPLDVFNDELLCAWMVCCGCWVGLWITDNGCGNVDKHHVVTRSNVMMWTNST